MYTNSIIMKIIGVLSYKKNILKESEFDLSFVNFFARSSTKELLIFFCTEIIKSIKETTKMQVTKHEQTNSKLYVLKDTDDIVCLICDDGYPMRVAFSILQSIVEKKYTLRYVIIECQQPEKIDQLMRIKKNMDETKIVLYDTIEKTLDRGEKLDELIEKSEHLSQTTKDFTRHAKKLNSCCYIM